MNMTNNQAIGKTKNTASTTNRLHKLIHITALLGIAIFGSIDTYAGELRSYFDDASQSIIFSQYNIDDKWTAIDGHINQEDFLIDSTNNTTYIDTNTLPISNNTGGGGSKSKYRW